MVRCVNLQHPVPAVTPGDVYHHRLTLLVTLKAYLLLQETSKNHPLWVLAAKPALFFLCLLLQLPNAYSFGTWTVAGSSNGCTRQFVTPDLEWEGTLCVVYRKACVYPCRRLLSSCSINLIFRMCFLNPSFCLSFQWQLSLPVAFTIAACGECNTEIKSSSVNLPALLTTRESSVGHQSGSVVSSFEYQTVYHQTVSKDTALVVKLGFIRLVTSICRASSLQVLCLCLQHAQSDYIPVDHSNV